MRQPPSLRLSVLRRTYQVDAFQLLRARIVGGKGIPDTVAVHPAVFATLTAPGFGTVHTRYVKRHTCTDV